MGDWWLNRITAARIPYCALLGTGIKAKELPENKRNQTITPFSLPAHVYQNPPKGIILPQL